MNGSARPVNRWNILWKGLRCIASLAGEGTPATAVVVDADGALIAQAATVVGGGRQ